MFAAYFGLIFSVFIWGSNFIAGDWLVMNLNSVLLAMTRLIFSSLFLLTFGLIARKFTRINKKQFGFLIMSAIIGTLINQACFFTAMRYIPPTESALIMSLCPVATAALAFLFLRERITWLNGIGSFVAIFGVFLLVVHGSHLRLNIGDAFSFTAMFSLSTNMILVRKLSKDMDVLTITLYGTVLGTCLFIPTSIGVEGVPHYPHSFIFWIVCILSATLSQGFCSVLMNNAVSKIGATQVAVVANLQPFISMVVGFLALGIPVTSIQIIGGIVIIIGVLIATVKIKQKSMFLQHIRKSTFFRS